MGCYCFTYIQSQIYIYGYGSIPIHTIFRGMNIHLPAILMFTRGTRFWHTAIYIYISHCQWREFPCQLLVVGFSIPLVDGCYPSIGSFDPERGRPKKWAPWTSVRTVLCGLGWCWTNSGGFLLTCYTAWWFQTWILFSIYGIIIPTDELIFFRGVGIPPTSIFLLEC